MTNSRFQNILVATDFLPHSEAALKQAIWLARQSKARITLAHVLPNLRQAMLSASPAAQQDMFFGEGEKFQREIREESNARMQFLITKLSATDLGIQCETILGDPAIAIVHAVQKERYDLVLVGTRGQAAWERFVMGSTAKRLIRQCPAPVWAVKAGNDQPPQAIMVATDFSEVSRLAVSTGRDIAIRMGAQFHLLHVIDSQDIPEQLIERMPSASSFREEIRITAARRLEEFVASLAGDVSSIHSHLSWGIANQEIARTAAHLKIDLLVLGTVGRSGIKGVLLGNTAEKVLDSCDCSILAVKPEDYICPIEPAFWPLHPDAQINAKD